MSGGVAHADPSFATAESQARAGDTVHFSITGADGRVTYEIEVGGRDVLKGSGTGKFVSGQFTMPDFGGSAKSVRVEADLSDSDDSTEVNRKLQYLGPALAAPEPAAAPTPAPAAPAPPQQTAAAVPAPGSTLAAPASSTAPAPVAKHRSKGTPRTHARKRRKVKRQRAVSRQRVEHKRTSPSKKKAKTKKRKRRSAARTAPLFDGVPEPGSERYSPDDETLGQKKTAPPASVFASTVASRESGEPAMAILIPGLLGLAGFTLAAVTLVRRRRTR